MKLIHQSRLYDFYISANGTLHSVLRSTGKTNTVSGSVNSAGYIIVQLRSNGKRKVVLLHRLVAEAYIPNPHNKPTVNHIDGNKLNNAVNNLEWMTMAEQNEHAIKIGLK
jgi:hypothetical protein